MDTMAPSVAEMPVLDDRGLEYAEDFLHERRVSDELQGRHDPRTYQALAALGEARSFSK